METRGSGEDVIIHCHPDDLTAAWAQQRKAMYERRGKTVIVKPRKRAERP